MLFCQTVRCCSEFRRCGSRRWRKEARSGGEDSEPGSVVERERSGSGRGAGGGRRGERRGECGCPANSAGVVPEEPPDLRHRECEPTSAGGRTSAAGEGSPATGGAIAPDLAPCSRSAGGTAVRSRRSGAVGPGEPPGSLRRQVAEPVGRTVRRTRADGEPLRRPGEPRRAGLDAHDGHHQREGRWDRVGWPPVPPARRRESSMSDRRRGRLAPKSRHRLRATELPSSSSSRLPGTTLGRTPGP